jgi:hypothetical protein
MPSDIENLQAQIRGLEGELVATQMTMIHILRALLLAGSLPRNVVEGALGAVDIIAESSALLAGKQGHPIHTAQYLTVVEYMRAEILRQ